MTITLFDVLRTLFFLVIFPVFLVEVIGYSWHRLVEHNGKLPWKRLREWLRDLHWKHHEEDYPVNNLRPANSTEYQSSGEITWTWYAIGLVTLGILYPLFIHFLSLRDWILVAIGAPLYAKFVLDLIHGKFHLPNTRLRRYGWFKRLEHLHDIHHYVPGNYGIVFFWMDKICRTYVKELPGMGVLPDARLKKNIFPGRVSAQ